jgi:ABC-2 type transport system permease protein
MLTHIWKVFSYEISRQGRRRGYLLMTFGIPLVALVLLLGYKIITDMNAGNAAAEEEDEFANIQGIQAAGYVDFSGLFPEPPENSILTRYDDEAAAQTALDLGDIDAYYVIPADYLETGEVIAYVPTVAFDRVINADAIIEPMIFDGIAGNVDEMLLTRLRTPTTNIIEVDVSREGTDGGDVERSFDADFAIVYVFAIALLMGVFTTNGYLMQSVIDEKETRLIEILISTIRPMELLTGKIFAMGLLGLFQIVVWIGSMFGLIQLAAQLGITGTILDSLVIPWSLTPLLLLYFVLAYLFFAGAYGAVGALSNSMQEGPQYAVIFTLPATIPLYFISLFLTSPNGGLPVVLSLFPLTAPLSMVQRLVLTTVPPLETIVSLVLLALTDVFIIWAAGKLFRVQSLLAGQVPKLREIPRLLRS